MAFAFGEERETHHEEQGNSRDEKVINEFAGTYGDGAYGIRHHNAKGE